MAKSKNHTNANQVAKAHKKGGIKRPQRQRYPSLSQVINNSHLKSLTFSKFEIYPKLPIE